MSKLLSRLACVGAFVLLSASSVASAAEPKPTPTVEQRLAAMEAYFQNTDPAAALADGNGKTVAGLTTPVVGVPGPARLPRLDFFYGAQRIATVTRDGVYEVDYEEASMPSEIPDGAFAILCSGATVALIEAGRLRATQFQVSA